MKKFWYEHKRIVLIVSMCIVAITFIFLIPIGINLAYKTPAYLPIFAMDWEAKDVLTFYGALLSFTGTLVLGVATYNISKKANTISERAVKLNKEIHCESVLPYIAIVPYLCSYSMDDFEALDYFHSNKDSIQKENTKETTSPKRIDYIVAEFFCTISEHNATFSSKLTEEQYKAIQTRSEIREFINGVGLYAPKQYYQKYKLMNCGNGTAVNLSLSLFNSKNPNSPIGFEKGFTNTIPITLPKDEHIDLGIYIDLSNKFNEEYSLCISYKNIFGHCYEQRLEFKIDTNSGVTEFDLGTKQKRIEIPI